MDVMSDTPNQPSLLDTNGLTLLSQGAEARVWQGHFLGRPAIIKHRFNKKYRHPVLDNKLTSQRLKQEVRCMLRARKLGIPTPVVYQVDQDVSTVCMQLIPGHSLKTTLQQPGINKLQLVKELGIIIAKLHDGDLVHGDLTSSNVLVVQDDSNEGASPTLVLIDFGLSYFSTVPEDRAVDLYVLERAFTSAHAEDGEELFAECLEAYRKTSRNQCSTLNRFADVRMRGRKRSMVG